MSLGVCPTSHSSSLEILWGKGGHSSDFSNCKTWTLEPHLFSWAQFVFTYKEEMPLSLCCGKWVWEWLSRNGDAGGMWPCSPAGVCAPEAFLPSPLISVPHWVGLGFAQFVSCHEKLLLLRVNLDSCLPFVLVWLCDLVSPSQWGRGIRSQPAQSHKLHFPAQWGILSSSRSSHCSFPAGFGAEFSSQLRLEGSGCSSTRVLGWKEGEGAAPRLCSDGTPWAMQMKY